jgi:cobalt-zinc-cadmium efflux system outer membrane protein
MIHRKYLPGFARPCPRRTPVLLGALAGLALLAAWPAAHGAELLTEQDAVRRALTRPAFQDALQGGTAAAEADVLEAGLWPNPHFDYEQERTGSADGDITEQRARLAQSFDISGRRALRREAAEQRVAASRHDAAARRTTLSMNVRLAFHDSLGATRRIAVLRDWQAALLRAEDTLTKLQRGGEVSGYDRRRIVRERLSADARLSEALAESERARERLGALTGVSTEATLVGDPLPGEPPPLESLLEQVPMRGDLRALAARTQAHDAEGRAAARAWVPDVTLGAGVKRVEEAGRSDSGLLISVSVPIPLFERGQAAGQRAAAQARATQGEYQLALAEAQGELRGFWREAARLRQTALTFAELSPPASEDLVRIAEAAYRGGEIGILELLDAFRSRVEAQTEALELQLKARRARIELDTLVGADLP